MANELKGYVSPFQPQQRSNPVSQPINNLSAALIERIETATIDDLREARDLAKDHSRDYSIRASERLLWGDISNLLASYLTR